MKKPIIAIDIDDVIADSTETMRIRVNKRTGAQLEPEHYQMPYQNYMSYYERVWKNHGVDIAYDDLLEEMEADQANVPLLAGASFAIAELTRKHDIIIITSRPRTWESKTMDWLKTQLGDIFISIHFTDKDEPRTKGQICKELGAEWLIDDNPEHCQSAIDEGIKAILFGKYGWHHKAPKHLVRCKDWPEVMEYFNAQA
jgi:5'(3')-deoxyribonucleotidase